MRRGYQMRIKSADRKVTDRTKRPIRGLGIDIINMLVLDGVGRAGHVTWHSAGTTQGLSIYK